MAGHEEIIRKLQREMIGGVLVTDGSGNEVFRDDNVTVTGHFPEQAKKVCPASEREGKVTAWEYLEDDGKKYCQILTATGRVDGELYQVHQIVDISESISLFSTMSDFSRGLKTASEHDKMTGLYNKGMYMKRIKNFYPARKTVTVFNMDVNNLKTINDTMGHGAGDRLLIKAAESIKSIISDKVEGYRLGGDEFMVLAHDLTEDESLKLKSVWEAALADLNEKDDEFMCVIACGMAYGSGRELEELLRLADMRMYEDKKAKKKPGEEIR